MPEAPAVVLIVEDERPIATLLAKLVEGCGVETAITHNGAEALRWMMLRRPDLVLLDLIMPVMSGEDVLSEMRQDPRLAGVPVIVITTKDMMPDSPPLNADLLQKPFAPAEVKQRIRAMLKLPPPQA
ncbi:MAG: response regulator [Armatimonadetes bacterium]|nr:response regulator [Armatimonadota bacterium]